MRCRQLSRAKQHREVEHRAPKEPKVVYQASPTSSRPVYNVATVVESTQPLKVEKEEPSSGKETAEEGNGSESNTKVDLTGLQTDVLTAKEPQMIKPLKELDVVQQRKKRQLRPSKLAAKLFLGRKSAKADEA